MAGGWTNLNCLFHRAEGGLDLCQGLPLGPEPDLVHNFNLKLGVPPVNVKVLSRLYPNRVDAALLDGGFYKWFSPWF